MTTTELRKELRQYIDKADSRFITLVYAMMKADEEGEEDFVLSSAHKKELDTRVKRHKSGESKSYSWEEVKQRARSQR